MAETTQLGVNRGDVMLLLGTAKGDVGDASAGGDRRTWEVGGPHFPGHKIYSLAYDARNGRNRLWAGTCHNHFGTVLSHSDDLGKTWDVPADFNLKFPEGGGDGAQAGLGDQARPGFRAGRDVRRGRAGRAVRVARRGG